MKRLVMFLLILSLTGVLTGCSNPLKAASDVVESTTETVVTLDDPSVPPSFLIYDADDSSLVALELEAVYVDWHYEDEDGNEVSIRETEEADPAVYASADASGDASGDGTATSSGDASAYDGTQEAIIAAAYISLETLDVDDDSETYYSVDPGATPDKMVQSSWKDEYIGDESADAMEIYTKLTNFYSLPMKTARVYQVTVTWDEENYENRGYYGELTYMFRTQ